MPSRRAPVLLATGLALALLAPALLPAGGVAAASVLVITDAQATPLKAGDRIAFTWTTPFAGSSVVRYGATAASLTTSYGEPVSTRTFGLTFLENVEARAPATAHLLVLDNLGRDVYYYQVETTSPDGALVARSPVQSVQTINAYTREDAPGIYRVNLLVRLDWDLRTAPEWAYWSGGMREFATRVNDATDGHVQIANLILADSTGQAAAGVSFCDLATCATGADALYNTVLGFDSHTTGMGIDGPNPMNLGRFGQLVTPWMGPAHLGYVLAHEFLHYAGGMEDQYAEASAVNGAIPCEGPYDVSIMSNGNTRTELDSMATPCRFTAVKGYSSWDILRGIAGETPGKFYNIPARGIPDPGPTDPGPAYALVVMDRGIKA